MDARDLVRILSLEQQYNCDCYTISLVTGSRYRSDRHLRVDFTCPSFIRQLKEKFLNISFNEIFLDYFWIPGGTWQIEHWKDTFFKQNIPNFLGQNILCPGGSIFLPFTLYILKCIVNNFDIIHNQFEIKWVYPPCVATRDFLKML